MNHPNYSEEWDNFLKLIPDARELVIHQQPSLYATVGKLLAEAYKDKVLSAVLKAIHSMQESECQALTLLLNPKDKLQVVLDNKTFETELHCVHYGGKPKTSWYRRFSNPCFVGIFKEIQQKLATKGYWLLDMSDPSKSFSFVVIISCVKPHWYDTTQPLWHGLNQI